METTNKIRILFFFCHKFEKKTGVFLFEFIVNSQKNNECNCDIFIFIKKKLFFIEIFI